MKLLLVPYFGGKYYMVNNILNIMPEHKRYLEPFGGAGSILLNKPIRYDIYNDVNQNVVTLFNVLRDKEKFEEFKRLLYLTPFSREVHKNYKKDLNKNNINSDIERSYKWYYVLRSSFSGVYGGSFAINQGLSDDIWDIFSYLNGIEKLDYIVERLRHVVIENKDFRDIFDIYVSQWDNNSIVYCDPPYVPETRKCGGYEHEMSLDDHIDLIELLIKYENQVKFILSGYANDLYKKLEDRGWQRIDFDTVCWSAGRTKTSKLKGKDNVKKYQKRVESVWINYKLQDTKELF